VVGTWAGGVPEVIKEGIDGFLVAFGDYHRIAEYVCTLLQSPSTARAMGEAGRRKVVSECTWGRRCGDVERFWGELLT
jgi:glycosyltransferase involved in cell wall biosynthesis